MSPLEIEILLWYFARCSDFRDGDFSAPAVRGAIDTFRDVDKLIEPIASGIASYQLTERGKAYVNALLAIPLPVCRWEIPQQTAA